MGIEEKNLIEIPFDPHLTKLGCEQARSRGKVIRKILDSYSEKTGKKVRPVLMSSPFLRTIMTTYHIASQLENIYENTIYLQENISELLWEDDFKENPLDKLYITKYNINDYIDLEKSGMKLGGNFLDDPTLPKARYPEPTQVCDKRMEKFFDAFHEYFFKNYDHEEFVPILVSHRYVLESAVAQGYFKAKTVDFDYCGMLHVEYPDAPKEWKNFKVLHAGV